MNGRPVDIAFRRAAVALLALLWTADAVPAQSLADVARQEETRRGASPAGRVYTDADLRPVAAPPRPPSAVPAAAPEDAAPAARASVIDGEALEANREERDSAAKPGAGGTVIEAREKRDEEYWRNRARDVRGRLARAEADVEAAERRLAAIDDGAPVSAAHERHVVSGALEQLRANVGFLRHEVDVFEARARIENVPEEWTR